VLSVRTAAGEHFLTATAAAMTAAVALALVEVGIGAGFALALLPLLALAAAYVLTSGQVVLYAAAIALPGLTISAVGHPLVGGVYLPDVIVVCALGVWAFSALSGPGRVASIPHTPVLGWAFVLFAAPIVIATLRGHYAYEASLVGQPLRLIFYAGIVAGLAGMTAQRMHRLLLLLLYPSAVLLALVALYYLASGGSATDQDVLSTGGMRLFGISTSAYCAGALFFALLNLRLASSAGARVLHLGIGLVATFGVVAGFGRAVYTAVALVCLLFILTSPRLRNAALSVVPLVLPFVALLAIGISHGAPDLVDSVVSRVSSPPAKDADVQWRLKANRAVLAQIREQPIFGVGFGRTSDFFINVEDRITGLPIPQRFDIGQDPHNGYFFLWAGGGLLALGAFALLLGTYAIDAFRRYRSNHDPTARLIIVWGSATLFVFLFNAASGTSLSNPSNVLVIWALLVLPAVVLRGSCAGGQSGRRPAGGPTVGRDGGLGSSSSPAWLKPCAPVSSNVQPTREPSSQRAS
jgi:O-antigen ligase